MTISVMRVRSVIARIDPEAAPSHRPRSRRRATPVVARRDASATEIQQPLLAGDGEGTHDLGRRIGRNAAFVAQHQIAPVAAEHTGQPADLEPEPHQVAPADRICRRGARRDQLPAMSLGEHFTYAIEIAVRAAAAEGRGDADAIQDRQARAALRRQAEQTAEAAMRCTRQTENPVGDQLSFDKQADGAAVGSQVAREERSRLQRYRPQRSAIDDIAMHPLERVEVGDRKQARLTLRGAFDDPWSISETGLLEQFAHSLIRHRAGSHPDRHV
jgi:hypothetical protein